MNLGFWLLVLCSAANVQLFSSFVFVEQKSATFNPGRRSARLHRSVSGKQDKI